MDSSSVRVSVQILGISFEQPTEDWIPFDMTATGV